MSNEITINLQYRLTDAEDWQTLQLTPEEYFDLEAGEKPALDSVPEHNHVADYLDINPKTIRNTKVIVTDAAAQKNYMISETFWNSGQNRVIRRIDQDLTSGIPIFDEEIIIASAVDLEENCNPHSEVLRLCRREDFLFPTFHGFYAENPDGSETETKVLTE